MITRAYPKRPTYKKKPKQDEKKLSYKIAEYMEKQYPKVIFRFDVASDLYMTINQATTIRDKLRHKRGFPDMQILKANSKYHGLFIELKNGYSDVFKKDGDFKKSKHIQEQHEMHERLRAEGYHVVWGLGFDDTVNKIREYMK